jgi:hypothetical protein
MTVPCMAPRRCMPGDGGTKLIEEHLGLLLPPVCPYLASAVPHVLHGHAAVRLLQEGTRAAGSERAAGTNQSRKSGQDASPGRPAAAAVLLEAAKMQHAEVHTCTALSLAVSCHVAAITHACGSAQQRSLCRQCSDSSSPVAEAVCAAIWHCCKVCCVHCGALVVVACDMGVVKVYTPQGGAAAAAKHSGSFCTTGYREAQQLRCCKHALWQRLLKWLLSPPHCCCLPPSPAAAAGPCRRPCSTCIRSGGTACHGSSLGCR